MADKNDAIYKIIQEERKKIGELRRENLWQEFQSYVFEYLKKRIFKVPYFLTILYCIYLGGAIVVGIFGFVNSDEYISMRIIQILSVIILPILLIIFGAIIPHSVPPILVKRYEIPQNIRQNQRIKYAYRILMLIIILLFGVMIWLDSIDYLSTEIFRLFTIIVIYGLGTVSFLMNLTMSKLTAMKMDWHNFFMENRLLDEINKEQLKKILNFMILSKSIKTLTLKFLRTSFKAGKNIEDLKKELEKEKEKKRTETETLESLLNYQLISCQPEFKWINMIIERFSLMIEYFIVPNVSVNLRNDDSHRLFIALNRNEEIIVNHFVDCICTLNMGEFVEFYFKFHRLMQHLRSENLKKPTDAFIFSDNLTIARRIRNFFSKLLNSSISKDLFVGSLLVIITYLLTKMITG